MTGASSTISAAIRLPGPENAMRCVIVVVAAIAIGCASTQADTDTRNAAGTQDVVAFYDVYTAALRAQRRDTLARFYHPNGALVVFNGQPMQLTNASIDSFYRGPWQGPQFFSFDSLRFQPLNSSQVLVTGGFRWQWQNSADTTRYVYLSILERTRSGLRIRLEHETEWPKPQR